MSGTIPQIPVPNVAQQSINLGFGAPAPGTPERDAMFGLVRPQPTAQDALQSQIAFLMQQQQLRDTSEQQALLQREQEMGIRALGDMTGGQGGPGDGADGQAGAASDNASSNSGEDGSPGSGSDSGDAGDGDGDYARGGLVGYARGGVIQLQGGGKIARGLGGGLDDLIPTTINGSQAAALSDGEFVMPADVVSMMGDGSSDAGSRRLYDLIKQIRQEKTGRSEQAGPLNIQRFLDRGA